MDGMTKTLEAAIRHVETLPEEKQDFYAALLTAEMDQLPFPKWQQDLIAERDRAAGSAREPGITLAELDAIDAGNAQ
jgi:hypothetical protein